MPGFLYHFACSEYVLQNRLDLQSEANRKAFLLGNVIPDLAIDKDASHFRHVHVSGWKTLSLTAARQTLLANPNPLLLGCYCHLFLDHYFITNHLAHRFFLVYDHRVIDFEHDRVCNVDTFLSINGLYGAYDNGNALLVDEGLLPDRFLELPVDPPFTGISVFDERSDKNWHAQVERYLSSSPNGNANAFTPEELRDITLKGAKLFLNDIHSLQFASKIPSI